MIYTTPNEYIITLKKNVTEENINQEFRPKNMDGIILLKK